MNTKKIQLALIAFATLNFQLLTSKVQAQVCFSAATNYTVGNDPSSIISADYNGDGFADLVIANLSSNSISLLLGDGVGNFAAATDFAASTPQSVINGDFNSDGKTDLAVANYNSNQIFVLLGDGAGGFGIAINFTVGYYPYSIISADFNGDGKADLAVANRGSNSVSVLLGDGLGSFTTTNFTAGNCPQSVVNGDFNGDGKIDLAVANSSGNNVSILLGNGTGGFSSATNFITSYDPRQVISADFNGDGKIDLATANHGNATVSVLLGNGAGHFGSATNFGVSSNAESVISRDFNGDGKVDLAAVGYNGNNVSILLGNGLGNFGTVIDFAVGGGSTSIISVDFNGDGKTDLATDNAAVLFNSPLPVTANASATTVCAGTLVTLTGSGASAYTWTEGVIDGLAFVPSSTATYMVTGITTSGCYNTATKTITVNPLPISNAGNDLIICSGIIDSIGAASVSGYTYSWSPASGLSNLTVSSPVNTMINGSSTPIVTTFSVTTTNSATGCQSTDSAVITVNSQPVLVITNPAATCFLNTIDITATAVTAGSTGGGILSYWTDVGATNPLSSPNAITANGTNYINCLSALDM